jgi:hypothetical protein
MKTSHSAKQASRGAGRSMHRTHAIACAGALLVNIAGLGVLHWCLDHVAVTPGIVIIEEVAHLNPPFNFQRPA